MSGKSIAVLGLVGAVVGIIGFSFDIFDRFISTEKPTQVISLKAPSIEDIVKLHKPKFWSKADISGWHDATRWKIELNKNYNVGGNGVIFNGMIENPSFQLCAQMCLQNNCDLWIYERAGWCRVYKGKQYSSEFTKPHGYNSNYHIVGRKL